MFQHNPYHIDAKVIADSTNEMNATRITTMQIRVPRMILAEFNTHRNFSRNFASSRAIPAKKTRAEVLENPMMPVYWGANQSGMSAKVELEGWRKTVAQMVWKSASLFASFHHWILEKVGLHKQTANRIIEPYLSVTGVVTSTEWNNFFKLRINEMAQPEMQCLATAMKTALDNSEPKMLKTGEVHLPYIDEEEFATHGKQNAIKMSVARCCRTSYNNMLGFKSQPEEDIKLFERAITNEHWSPTEHISFVPFPNLNRRVALKNNLERNLEGWCQLRGMLDNAEGKHILETKFDAKLTVKE